MTKRPLLSRSRRTGERRVVVEVAEEDAEYMKAEMHEEETCGHGLALNYPIIEEIQKIKEVGINEEKQQIKKSASTRRAKRR